MPYASSGAAKIYYEVHGTGPAVLFVHGSGGHHAAWWQQVAALSGSSTVITIDLRGFGNSRWESDHDVRNFPGDIVAVLDAVASSGGPSQAVLVGQSIGAAAALRAALDRPDRAAGVILAHSLGGLRDSELTALVKADRARAEQLPGARPAADAGVPGRTARPGVPVQQMGTFNTAKMQDLRELLPSACVEVVTGATHSMYWETPALFNDAVARFLKDVAGA
jgi:pimeloyl-ACP methyl ester carboxylesterase